MTEQNERRLKVVENYSYDGIRSTDKYVTQPDKISHYDRNKAEDTDNYAGDRSYNDDVGKVYDITAGRRTVFSPQKEPQEYIDTSGVSPDNVKYRDTSEYQTNPMYEKLLKFRQVQQKKRFTVEDLLKW